MKSKLISGVLFIVFVLVACTPATISTPAKTATPSPTSTPVPIEREQAIQNAVQACPGFGLLPVEQPTEFQTELTTYKKVQYGQYGLFHVDSDRPVWVVKMMGRWLLIGGPPPDPASNPEPSYWDECTIVIDAWTGESLTLPIE